MKFLFCLSLLLALSACNANENSGGPPSLSELRGQWVVVNYWAQWCKPCIAEIPELNALDQEYPLVTVLGVNYDGATGTELQTQREKLGIRFRSLEADPAAKLGTSRPVVLPSTLIVNPDGQLVTTLVGPQTLESLAQATHQTAGEGQK